MTKMKYLIEIEKNEDEIEKFFVDEQNNIHRDENSEAILCWDKNCIGKYLEFDPKREILECPFCKVITFCSKVENLDENE